MSGVAFGFLVLFAVCYSIGLALFCGADLLKIHRCVWRAQDATKGKLSE